MTIRKNSDKKIVPLNRSTYLNMKKKNDEDAEIHYYVHE